MVAIHPLGVDDAVHVRGKHLFTRDGTSFVVKGLAFPTPPSDYLKHSRGYNATAWLDILRQLRAPAAGLEVDFNAVRLYRLFPQNVDYREFFEGAAELGIYIIVPLTSASGAGVLDRTVAAPKCYNRTLFQYGATALAHYLNYPNVLAGVIGNEVLNDEEAWRTAPCIRAYARDLKLFMDRMVDEAVFHRTLPLIYAAQDASVLGGAEMDKDDAMRLTAEYLTCAEKGKGTIVADVAGNEPPKPSLERYEDNKFGQSPVDIFGVNVESWCSSTQNYRQNPDGTKGTYSSLHDALRNISVPIIFTEMGCPHSQFDKDDPERRTKEGTRDWNQIPIVMHEMADSWSGFVAYAYDGPTDFDMTAGGPWNGVDTLPPTQDLYNFKQQLDLVSGLEPSRNGTRDDNFLPRRCSSVETDLLSCCDLRLFNDDVIQSYQKTAKVQVQLVQPAPADPKHASNHAWYSVAILTAFVLLLAAHKGYRSLVGPKNGSGNGTALQSGASVEANYGSI